MLSTGKELYDARGRQVIIDKVQDDVLYVTTIAISRVSFNNGTESMVEKRRNPGIYNVDDLGIQLFFNKEDINKGANFILDSPLYAFNRDNIRMHTDKKYNGIMKKIRSEAPKISMSESEKERIIKGYSSREESYREEIDFYNDNYKNQEYFARIDLDTEYYIPKYEEYHRGHYYEKFYIGKNVKSKTPDRNIIDWRDTDIASLFYDSKKTNIIKKDVGVYNSEVMLKRSFKFNPLEYQNLYIMGIDLYEEGKVDPFLLEVLEENRSNHKIGDIIKSIQSNQNKIIRGDSKRNIIVQGCAGSGKTMILLHRLSYLKFNSYLHDTSRVKIVTPNYLFTSFLNELSSTLELDEIEHTTIQDYYISSIDRYIRDFDIKPNGKRYKNAIEKVKRRPDRNKSITGRYEEYFSKFFVEYIEEFYNNKLIEYKNSINSDNILEIAYKVYESEDIIDSQTNNDFFNHLYRLSDTEILRKNKELEQRLNECNNTISNTYEYLDKVAIHEHEITILLEMLKRRELELATMESLHQDHISDYIEGDIEDNIKKLSRYISERLNSLELINNNLGGLGNIESKESKNLLYSCFNIINNSLLNLRLKYNKGNYDTNKDLIEDYTIVLKEGRKVCETNISKIKQIKEGYINKLEKNIQRRHHILDIILVDEEINMLKPSRLKLYDRDEFIIEIWLELLGDLYGSVPDNLIGNNNTLESFILLNLYYLHYGPMISKDDFLFIDEGQDYSSEEYKLINNINDGRVIFNIYGDINQSLDSERKIEDWSHITDILEGNYYELNENYRNTIQITEFCNKEFDFTLNPIGLQGPKVEHVNQWQIEEIVDNILYKDSRTRIAIITKENETSIDRLSKKYGEYKDNSIIIGDVRKIKGLEFDTVFVFPKNMSKNELYISYSRSLRKLYIINQN